MAAVLLIVILLLLLAIVLVVSAPLRAAATRRETETETETDMPPAETPYVSVLLPSGMERDELEAAREAKYREIRDAEMDFRTGKLSEADYRTLDAELRGEALAILDDLTALEDSGEPTGED